MRLLWCFSSPLFQLSSVTESSPTLGNPTDCSMPGLPVHHQLLELTQTHVHWVSDAFPPSHPLSSPSPPAFNLSQHQGLVQWVGSFHQVAKVLHVLIGFDKYTCPVKPSQLSYRTLVSASKRFLEASPDNLPLFQLHLPPHCFLLLSTDSFLF